MASVRRRDGESLESMLHRFKRVVNDAGIISDLKKHEFHMTKSQKRREKSKAARLKRQKAERAARRRLARMD